MRVSNILSFALGVSSCNHDSWRTETNHGGKDYKHLPSRGAADCLQHCCSDATRCRAFTWTSYQPHSTSSCSQGSSCCWLKSSANGLYASKSNCTSAEVPAAPSPSPGPVPSMSVSGVVMASGTSMALPWANVTITSSLECGCIPKTQLAAGDGRFALQCSVCDSVEVIVWARQYTSARVNVSVLVPDAQVMLMPRPIPNFPAFDWRFDGWAAEANTGDVPGTNISFLAHPSAYRTPSGRIFMISTANTKVGPGWTQGYWQDADGALAKALPYQLINHSHPVLQNTAFSGRLVFAEGRLLMLVGYTPNFKGKTLASLLENKNLEDPSRPEDWVAAEGDGHVHVNFTGAPTSSHEDYRLHIFEDAPADSSGRYRKYWLLVVPGRGSPFGRACGKMAFSSEALTGPYTYSHWMVSHNGTKHAGSTSNCGLWPGDIIQSEGQSYFVGALGGNIYSAPRGSMTFERLPEYPVLTLPAPPPAYDDSNQIEYAFLAPASIGDGRYRLYYAAYSLETENTQGTRPAAQSFKQAIGMYSFSWPSSTMYSSV